MVTKARTLRIERSIELLKENGINHIKLEFTRYLIPTHKGTILFYPNCRHWRLKDKGTESRIRRKGIDTLLEFLQA